MAGDDVQILWLCPGAAAELSVCMMWWIELVLNTVFGLCHCVFTLRHLINTDPECHEGCVYVCVCACVCIGCVTILHEAVCVIVWSLQRRGLVVGTLPEHWRERLHPQQLCGSIWLHPGRRVKALHYFSCSFPFFKKISFFHRVHW